jgi:hypothetical protein
MSSQAVSLVLLFWRVNMAHSDEDIEARLGKILEKVSDEESDGMVEDDLIKQCADELGIGEDIVWPILEIMIQEGTASRSEDGIVSLS